MIFAELKDSRGRVMPDQRRWANAVTGGCAEYYLWRATDADLILEVLA